MSQSDDEEKRAQAKFIDFLHKQLKNRPLGGRNNFQQNIYSCIILLYLRMEEEYERN